MTREVREGFVQCGMAAQSQSQSNMGMAAQSQPPLNQQNTMHIDTLVHGVAQGIIHLRVRS